MCCCQLYDNYKIIEPVVTKMLCERNKLDALANLLFLGAFRKTVLTLRRLMSYIYMEHPFLMFLDHTQRRSTVGRTPLDE